MALPERQDARALSPLPTHADPGDQPGYQPGGQVGWMQADLAHRLAVDGFARAVADASMSVRPGERVIRFVSVAGGYLALLAGYAGVLLLILR